MGLFKEIAEPLIARGVAVIPLRPATKVAFMSNWPEMATTDSKVIEQWDAEYTDANGACVARPDGVWFLEIDKEGYLDQIETETGQKLPATFMVRSSPGRGHLYFKQTEKSIAMGNVKVVGDDGKELFSARVNNAYVVAPGSYHPTSGRRYETLRDIEIATAPDWLVDWCASKRTDERKKLNASADGPPIPRGSHDVELFRIACLLRNAGMDYEQIKDNIIQVCERRCVNYGSDYVDMCERKAKQACKYPVGQASTVMLGGVPVGAPISLSTAGAATAPAPIAERPEVKPVAYPVFPRWVMQGTSVYEGLVEPTCAKNSRYPEYMFMPAVVVMLNYLALKVKIHEKNVIPSFFMIGIGRKGRVIKSASATDAIEYMAGVGICGHASNLTKNAAGKSLVYTAGSTEGLGMEMSRINCKNAVLFYDELSVLASKAAIEGSTLSKNLLTMYESDLFSNVIKARKESFSFEPRSYCASLIACTTDKNFHTNWGNLAKNSDGLDERFFFLYQPETLFDLIPYKYVNTVKGQQLTLSRINKAVQQQTYVITDDTVLDAKIGKLGNRAEIRAEKLALYFAVDLGKDEIDEECIDRAIAVVEYELAVKKYLKAFEGANKEALAQNEIIQLLQRNAGAVSLRKLAQNLHPERYGTSMWYKVYNGLIKAGWTAETGTGVKGDPKMLVLMRVPEEDE